MFPNRAPRYDMPAWSETKWLGGYNPDDHVGLFLHAGRMQADIDLWWVQIAAYLPDGTVAVDRSWGRTPDEWSLSTGVFNLAGQPDGTAACTFDGAAEPVTAKALTKRVAGSGSSVRLSWNLDAELLREPWSPFGHGDEATNWASDLHLQHQYRVTGTITIAGQRYSLDGPGWGDHSSGPRTWDGFGGHILVTAPLPDAGLILISGRHTDGGVRTMGTVVSPDGSADQIVEVDAPQLTAFTGEPHDFRLTVVTATGAHHVWQVEVLNTLPVTITETNSNTNGLDWHSPGNPVFFAECMARFTTPDGVVGYGHLERSDRRSNVSPDTSEVTIG
jgi:hypothetical protein